MHAKVFSADIAPLDSFHGSTARRPKAYPPMKSSDCQKILKDLSRFEAEISAHLQVRPLSQAVLRFVEEHLQLPYASLVLYDVEGKNLRLLATAGGESFSSIPFRLGNKTSITALALETCEMVYCRDISKPESRSDALVRRLPKGIRSIAVLPLQARESVLGTFNIGSPRVDGIASAHQAFFEAATPRLAAALRNAQVLEQLTSARRSLQQQCDLKNSALSRSVAELKQEVEERKRAQAGLRESEERFKAIADYTYGWESWLGEDGRPLWVNPGVEKLSGYSVAECLAMADYPMDFIHEEDRPRIRELFLLAISKRTSGSDIEFRIRHKSGDLRWMALSWQPIYTDRGRLMGFRSSIRDVSERKRAETILKKAHGELEIEVAQRTAEIRKLQERLQAENIYLKEELAGANSYGEIIGESPALKGAIARIGLVAPTNANVLILGESGTGKELIARAIHRHSGRKEQPLIKVNCATIPKELYESEFFGHVKGAFTGAVSDRMGRFEAADGGTLFLDEVGEIPLSLQGKLLRVLQEGEFERVGEGRTRKVDVRIIAATNKNLAEEIRHGRFREDLYYRLNVFPIEITPLREHKEDIPLLAAHFTAELSRRLNRPAPPLTQANLIDLRAHDWPGNVRELQNVIERALILSPSGRLRFDLPRIDSNMMAAGRNLSGGPGPPTAPIMTEAEVKALQKRNMLAALIQSGWKIYGPNGAAHVLGIKPTTLIERMRSLRIKKPG